MLAGHFHITHSGAAFKEGRSHSPTFLVLAFMYLMLFKNLSEFLCIISRGPGIIIRISVILGVVRSLLIHFIYLTTKCDLFLLQ